MHLEEAMMRLRSYPEFTVVMQAAAAQKPEMFEMDPMKPWEQQTALSFHRTGFREGFEFLFNYLTRGKP